MAFTGIKLSETVEYQSPNDPDKDNPTIFVLGPLSVDMESEIEKKTTQMAVSGSDGEAEVNVGVSQMQRDIMTVRYGLRDLKNFIHPDTGKPVVFDTVAAATSVGSVNLVSRTIIELFSKDLINELAEKISKFNKLSEAEEKN